MKTVDLVSMCCGNQGTHASPWWLLETVLLLVLLMSHAVIHISEIWLIHAYRSWYKVHMARLCHILF